MKSSIFVFIFSWAVYCLLVTDCALTIKPTTSKPTTAKPTIAKPTTSKPTTAKPTTAKPTTAKPLYLDPCQSYPCKRNGTCKRVNNVDYLCTCNPSIAFGPKCENLNPCWLFPCEHGGTCKPNGLNYTCSCTKSSYGKNCQFFRDSNANNSTILNYASMKNLKTLLNLPQNKSWYLLFQASFDGFNVSSFHSKCDGILGTLVLIKSENSNIFGGYTEADWKIDYSNKYDAKAFLFSLNNSYNIPVKMTISSPWNAIYSYPYAITTSYPYAITTFSTPILFGNTGNSDLSIDIDYALGFSYLGNSYRVPSFLSTDPSEINSFLGGSQYFKISEIEVFSVQVDSCNSSPCKNGGSCSFNGRNYYCKCTNGTSGLNCEIKSLNSTIFKDSTILTDDKSVELINLLNLNQTFMSKVNITLLYQASRDGFIAKSFHSKCDGILGTLTLVKSNNENIFGGYTKADWFSSIGYYNKYDDNAFLFSLVNGYNTTVKMSITNPNNAIVAADYLGPSFGSAAVAACDLCFYSSDLSFGESNLIGQNYQLPPFPISDTALLAGTRAFQAVQIEVYSIQF